MVIPGFEGGAGSVGRAVPQTRTGRLPGEGLRWGDGGLFREKRGPGAAIEEGDGCREGTVGRGDADRWEGTIRV